MTWGYCEGGGFSERSSATSIGAACGRLFRLRKTAMLSRHWRLWLSFPSLALPPEERLGIGLSFLSNLRAHESWARSFVFGMRSRRLTEPPRPCGVWGRNPSARLRRAEGVLGGGRAYLPPAASADGPLLLRKAAREGVPSCTLKAEGMKTD